MSENKLLEIKDLFIHYEVSDEIVRAVNGISFSIDKGETIGLVGETGAGKTTSALAIMGLIPNPPGKIVSGSILYEGQELVGLDNKNYRKLRGTEFSMIFQDPMTSLNPVMKIGDQVSEVIELHEKISNADAASKAVKMLEMVGIPSDRFEEYPHQFSGGMRQRVVIAIALACNPNLLIADEPTTALDVTIQAQVLDLVSKLQQEFNSAMLLITHDLGVVAEVCDKVAVMYAGSIVEQGEVKEVFLETMHPYTVGLFNSVPNLDEDHDRLIPIPGLMPDPTDLPEGCPFAPRCPRVIEKCRIIKPELTKRYSEHLYACFNPDIGGEF